MEVVEHEKRVELRDLVVSECPFQMNAGSLYGWLAFPDLVDLTYGFHFFLSYEACMEKLGCLLPLSPIERRGKKRQIYPMLAVN